jgi:O-antigen ligase
VRAPARIANVEFWFVAVAILLTAVLPGIAKYQTDDAGSTPSNEILWSLMYAVAAVRLYPMRAQLMALVRKSFALWIFLALIFASTLWSVEPEITFKNAIELIGTTLVGYYIVTRFTLQHFLAIFGVAFGVIGVLSLGLIFGAPAHGRMDWGGGAWSGLYQEKNNLAAAAALAIISQVLLLTRTRGRARLACIAGLALFCVLLVGAQSATAFASTAVVLLIPLTLAGWRSRTFATLTRIVIAVVVLAIAIGFATGAVSTDSLLGLVGRQSNLTGRADFWPYLQQAIADHPLLGYGYNAFFRSPAGGDYLASYVVQAGGWTPYHAHNSFLQIQLDAGYLGLGALLTLLAIALWRSVAFIRRDATALAVWPLAIVLHLILGSFTETYLARCNTMEWILFTAAFLYPLRGLAAERAETVASEPSARERARARIRARREARLAGGAAQHKTT